MKYHPKQETYLEYPLRKERTKKGLSVRKLAKLAEIDSSYLFRLEQGMYVASYEVAQRIIKSLK